MEFGNVTAAATEGVEPSEGVEPFVERTPVPYPEWIIRIIQCLAWSGKGNIPIIIIIFITYVKQYNIICK